MAIDPRDPDAALVVLFRYQTIPNEAKSAAEGRPIFDEIEVVDVRAPGSRNWQPFPAHAYSAHSWIIDPYTGTQKQITYAERFPRQYEQFKAKMAQTKSGTPLDYASFLTEGRRAELRAQNVYTVEQLAAMDGQELKNLGPGGREQKNQAEEFIAASKDRARDTTLAAELEALKARNQALEDDLTAAKRAMVLGQSEAQFEEMTSEQLREFIEVNTGSAPVGQLNRRTLVRMAMEARPNKAA